MTSVPRPRCVLALNAGSSTIRYALHDVQAPHRPLRQGRVERTAGTGNGDRPADLVSRLLDQLEEEPLVDSIVAVGHRVVHGMAHSQPEPVTKTLLAELLRITPLAPEHLPRELALIQGIRRRHPRLPQVACFDTAFHRTMPRVATLVPLPRHLATAGVRRYGFHGLSYGYLVEELRRLDPRVAQRRVILAHLGNGASLAALHHGTSIDTSMGFTPTGGLVMGTRSGDLDPGLFYFLARERHITAARFRTMVNEQSGLLGVSQTSADMRDLLAREATDARAAEAIALFCYQARKYIGAYAAALGGLDALVFSGGIGEHAPPIRARICEGLAFLGIEVDAARNATHAAMISPDAGRVQVRVIPTNEEWMIARDVVRTLGLDHDHARLPALSTRHTPLVRPHA